MFWSSFFVNKRGCPKKHIAPLFKALTGPNPYFRTERTAADCLAEFIEIHDSLLKEFVKSLNNLCLQWMNSDAGQTWLKMIADARFALNTENTNKRKNHKTAAALDAKHIVCVEYQGAKHDGLQIGMVLVWQFWKPILKIMDVCPLRVRSDDDELVTMKSFRS